jgi:hypothetical protein
MTLRGPVFFSAAALALSAAVLLSLAARADSAAITNEKAACELAKARVASQGRFKMSAIAFCDVIVSEAQPRGFFVLGLHGKRHDCGGICGSTLMGWFGVERVSGKVFEWDIEKDRPGREVLAKR